MKCPPYRSTKFPSGGNVGGKVGVSKVWGEVGSKVGGEVGSKVGGEVGASWG